jgi:hypothetical protein
MRHRHRGHRGEAGLLLCGDIRAEQGASIARRPRTVASRLPLLLLDVDVALNPFAASACPPGYTEHEFFPRRRTGAVVRVAHEPPDHHDHSYLPDRYQPECYVQASMPKCAIGRAAVA